MTSVGVGILVAAPNISRAGVLSFFASLCLGFILTYLGGVLLVDLLASQGGTIHHIPGILEKVFGRDGKILGAVVIFLPLTLALGAYIKVFREAFGLIGIFFYSFSFLFLLFSLPRMSRYVYSLAAGLVVLATIITFKYFSPFCSLPPYTDLESFLIISLFSLLAFFNLNVLPEAYYSLSGNYDDVLDVLEESLIAAFAIYFFVGISLAHYNFSFSRLKSDMYVSLFAFTAVLTSAIGVTISIKDILRLDFGLGKIPTLLYVLVVPTLLSFLPLDLLSMLSSSLLTVFFMSLAISHVIYEKLGLVEKRKVENLIVFTLSSMYLALLIVIS